MKKLICAAIVAGSMFAMAEEAAKTEAPATPAAAEAVKAAPKRPQISPEQQKKMMKEKNEQYMAGKKAKLEAKVLPIIKKYIPEEEKAKALASELGEAMITSGGPRFGERRPFRAKQMPTVSAKPIKE